MFNDDISFYVTGVLLDTEKIRLQNTAGQALRPEQNIAAVPLARKLNIQPGDSVTVFDTESGQEHIFIIE